MRAGELAAAGWWFSAGRLNRDWALDARMQILERGILVGWAHDVVEQLSDDLVRRPLHVLRALRLMTELAAASPSTCSCVRVWRVQKTFDLADTARCERTIFLLRRTPLRVRAEQ